MPHRCAITPTGRALAASGAAQTARARRPSRRPSPLWATAPFFAYIGAFLVLPTLIVAKGAFTDAQGRPTLANLGVLVEPNTVQAFGVSVLVSLASAVIGALLGALAAHALVVLSEARPLLRRVVASLCSVLAQFGGVMLAFAFIATIGITGIVTQLLGALGLVLDPNWLSTLPGLITVYCYFQIPLMIIVFLPAIDGIRPQWREATLVFGGGALDYWRRVAGPILLPSFLGSFLLLFANAFSSFATAAALFSQRSILVPLQIQSKLRNELDLGQDGGAAVLALAMIVVVAIAMTLNWTLSSRGRRWGR